MIYDEITIVIKLKNAKNMLGCEILHQLVDGQFIP